MEEPSMVDARPCPEGTSPQWGMLAPITADEVTRHLRNLKDGAPGPDRRKKADLLNLSAVSLACRFNTWLITGIAPESFRHGITVMIPKSSDSVESKQFRPITMGPILCRLYHRILAERIESCYQISERQKAFRRGDGIADNTHILRCVLADRQERCQPFSLAFLDISKAFDSVSHDSIFLAAATAGIPGPLVEYLRSLYAGSCTRLRVSGELSQEICITRGVRQGDPLSPVLFNSVIDLALRDMDTNIGVPVGGQTLSCLAFADDLVILAKTPRGLQTQFTIVERALGSCGLTLNAQKCNTIRTIADGKRKMWVVDPADFLSTRAGNMIGALAVGQGYKYLGNLVCVGKVDNACLGTLREGISQLTRAPLKPQQRMFFLRCNLLPSLLHKAVLGRTTRGTLDCLDRISRAAVRGWLRLPKDTPTAFIHANSRDGGLSVPIFKLLIPLLRIRRTSRMAESSDPVVREITRLPVFRRDERHWCKPLSSYGLPVRDGIGIRRSMAHGLHTSVDGLGLRDSASAGFVNQWMVNGSAFVTGRSFVNCVMLKGGLVYTALRASRGRPEASPRCDACNNIESVGHILQVCPRAHDDRVNRHDGVNKALTAALSKGGYTTRVEPAIPTPAGCRHPDLVAFKAGVCVVIDTTIIGDTFSLDDAHARKVAHYNVGAIRDWCHRESSVPPTDVMISACVLNWRGTPSPVQCVN